MWPFNSKKSYIGSGILEGFTDSHSHILPGVDDGIESFEDALALLREYERAGIKKVWLTPHIMEDVPNETSLLRERFRNLQNKWDGDVELRLASENMLDALFEERLNNNDLLPIGEMGSHLLVETSYFTPPYHMDQTLEAIKEKGYNVVLAHPERYVYMDENDYDRLKRQGVLFQMNMLSVIGLYGESALKKAQWLLKKGYVNLLGSDIHRRHHFNDFFAANKLPRKSIDVLSEIAQKAL